MKPSPELLAHLKEHYESKIADEVEVEAVKKKVVEGKGIFIVLDARPRAAFLEGHIRGALSVPLDQAGEAAKVLPIDRQYVTYCWSHT